MCEMKQIQTVKHSLFAKKVLPCSQIVQKMKKKKNPTILVHGMSPLALYEMSIKASFQKTDGAIAPSRMTQLAR